MNRFKNLGTQCGSPAGPCIIDGRRISPLATWTGSGFSGRELRKWTDAKMIDERTAAHCQFRLNRSPPKRTPRKRISSIKGTRSMAKEAFLKCRIQSEGEWPKLLILGAAKWAMIDTRRMHPMPAANPVNKRLWSFRVKLSPTCFMEAILFILNNGHSPPKARIITMRVMNLWKSSCSLRKDNGAGLPWTAIHAKGARSAPPGKTMSR